MRLVQNGFRYGDHRRRRISRAAQRRSSFRPTVHYQITPDWRTRREYFARLEKQAWESICQLRWRNPSPRGLPYGFSAARVSGVGIGDTCGSFSVPVMLKPGTPSRVSFRFKTRVRDAVPLT